MTHNRAPVYKALLSLLAALVISLSASFGWLGLPVLAQDVTPAAQSSHSASPPEVTPGAESSPTETPLAATPAAQISPTGVTSPSPSPTGESTATAFPTASPFPTTTPAPTELPGETPTPQTLPSQKPTATPLPAEITPGETPTGEAQPSEDLPVAAQPAGDLAPAGTYSYYFPLIETYKPPYPVNGVYYDLTYCTADGVALKLDLRYPGVEAAPLPLIVYIHGGYWRYSDKSNVLNDYNFGSVLLNAGYAVAAVNYRLGDTYVWPAQIEDVKCAVRFLRANAAKYHLDPNRIGVYGLSSGGHLAALVGLTGPLAGWDVGQYLSYSSSVRAVADLSGISNLCVNMSENLGNTLLEESVQVVFQTTDPGSTVLKKASPVTYASANAPPFLIMHGTADDVVYPIQSQYLYTALNKAGTPVDLIWVQGAGHQFTSTGTYTPSYAYLASRLVAFFDQNLPY